MLFNRSWSPASKAESRFCLRSRIFALIAGLSMPTTAWCSWVSMPSALHSAGKQMILVHLRVSLHGVVLLDPFRDLAKLLNRFSFQLVIGVRHGLPPLENNQYSVTQRLIAQSAST